MTAPNTGAQNVGQAPISATGTVATSPGAPGVPAPTETLGGEAGRPLTDEERASRPAHAGGFTIADRVGKLEKQYGARYESTHALDRSSFTSAIVMKDGTRIAANGATNEEAVANLESRLARIGEAFTNA